MPKIELICGDCLEALKTLEDKSIDLILQDPPYNTTACKWEWDIMTKIDEFWAEWKRVIKDNGAIVMTASQPFTSKLVMSNLKMFKYEWVWEKPQGVDPFMSKIRPLNNIEYVLVFANNKTVYNPQKTEGKPYKTVRDKKPRIKETNNYLMKQTVTINNGDRLPTRIISAKQEKGLHPTQKPVALMEYLIKTYTNEGDTVLDGFMGSGTTGVACKNLNRNFIGIELDPEYFTIAEKRIKDSTATMTDIMGAAK